MSKPVEFVPAIFGAQPRFTWARLGVDGPYRLIERPDSLVVEGSLADVAEAFCKLATPDDASIILRREDGKQFLHTLGKRKSASEAGASN